MSKIFCKIFIIICFFGLLSPMFVLAKGNITTGISDLKTKIAPGAGFTEQSPAVVIGNTIGLALGLVGIIFLILMVYGGFLWMTARGESEPVEKAQKIIKAAIIGIIIVMSAYAITVLVTERFVEGSVAVDCTVLSNNGKSCGLNGEKNKVCSDNECMTKCNVKYPTGTCDTTDFCNRVGGQIEINLCPGEKESDPSRDNVCCYY